MCNYITHVRACYMCAYEETVLISEKRCSTAKRSGVFGSCGRGAGNKPIKTPYQCWRCKEEIERISLARAMRLFATRHLHQHLGAAGGPQPSGPSPVALPAATVRAVQELVGTDHVAEFVRAATERELQARTMNDLARRADG